MDIEAGSAGGEESLSTAFLQLSGGCKKKKRSLERKLPLDIFRESRCAQLKKEACYCFPGDI